jgi:tetratricopeptide (TPR) repeat protein
MREALFPKEKYPDGHPELATSLDNLASLLKAQGEYGKAEPLYRRALEMRQALFPKESFPQGHPDLATSLNNLGAVLQDQGEYAKALGSSSRRRWQCGRRSSGSSPIPPLRRKPSTSSPTTGSTGMLS